jgi:hypothetical protein
MPYILRDKAGRIVAAGNEPLDGAGELIDAGSPELHAFLQTLGEAKGVFETSDLKLIRAIEDVIDVLIQKNLICITDLPQAVQSKLLERRSLRHSLNALKLFGDDDQGIL